MTARVVCISRSTGANGEAVGRLVSERLGFRYIDNEVIALASERAGVDLSLVMKAEQRRGLLDRVMETLGKLGETKDLLLGTATTDPPEEKVRQFIQDAITEIAKQGQVVIVAHAASFALPRAEDVLRVFVAASPETRALRLWREDQSRDKEYYLKEIAISDRNRQSYITRFYGVTEELPTHYDLVVNTDQLSIERAVAAVVTTALA